MYKITRYEAKPITPENSSESIGNIINIVATIERNTRVPRFSHSLVIPQF
jgi:hypothetical protein